MAYNSAVFARNTPPAPHTFEALKPGRGPARLSGDYAALGSTLQIVGEQLREALEIRSDHRVLDVAPAKGNLALTGPRRSRNAAGPRRIEFRKADAEALPFAAGSFDVVVSTFGVVFTADHNRVAAELVRVCKHGGKIGLADWTPESFIGQLFKIIGKHVPPSNAQSPVLWGTRARLMEAFERQVSSIQVMRRQFAFGYRSPQHWLDIVKTGYGPLLQAFAALPEAAGPALERDIITLIRQFNRAADGSMNVPGDYLEVVISRR